MVAHSSVDYRTNVKNIESPFDIDDRRPNVVKRKISTENSYHAASHGSPEKGEIPTTRMLKPIKEPLRHIISTTRGVLG